MASKPWVLVAALLAPINVHSGALEAAGAAELIVDPSESLINDSTATQPPKNTGYDFWPWRTDQPAAQPPQVQPYKIPTLSGDNLNFRDKLPPLVKAPHIDADAVYQYVLDCYPETSQWNLDVNLRAQIANTPDSILSSAGTSTTELGSSYIAIVASLPLYSSRELNREKERESLRRQTVATTVADFIAAIASRNHSIRELALYRGLEARSALRVQQGISEAKEQMAYLEKVAGSNESLIKQEAKIMESRLKLSGMCDPRNAKPINTWLKHIAAVPQQEASE